MRRSRLSRTAVLWIAAATKTLGAPEISLPVNAQVPPVARVSESFHYQFADTTFTSQDPSTLVYSLITAPQWLQLDSSTRTFSGTPSPQDLGSFQFLLNAADSTGAATMPVTFIVVNSLGPKVGISLPDQLEKFGSLSQGSSLEYYSNQAFNVVLTPGVFEGAQNMTYYATSANGSPLPSWLRFDPGTVTFSGLTPTPITSPDIFGVTLSASSTPGFADASIQFDFVISDHELLFSTYEQNIYLSSGDSISFTSLRDQLTLDGKLANDNQITSSQALTPSWMLYNPQTMSLSGKPPSGTASQDVTVSVSDVYGDTASTLLHFFFKSLVFSGDIGTLYAEIGSPFTYHIKRSIFTDPNVKVALDLGSASSWLKFDEADLTLHGMVPRTLKPTDEQLSITATLPSSTTTESQPFKLRIVSSQPPDTTNTPSLESSQMIMSPTAVPSSSSAQGSTSTRRHSLTGNEIAAIVVLATVAIAVLLLILFFRLKRRKNQGARWNSNSEKPRKSQIVPQRERAEPDAGHDVEVGAHGKQALLSPVPQLPGNIEGIGSSIRSSKYRYSSISLVIQSGAQPESNLNLDTGVKGKQGLKQADQAGTITVLSERNLMNAGVLNRQSQRISGSSPCSSGLPIERRLTGLGHGRSSYASQSRIFGSLRRSHLSDFSSLASYSTVSIQRKIESFPSAPRGVKSNTKLPGTEHERSWIRKVSEDLNEDHETDHLGISDTRPLEERRQSFIRWRASKGRNSNPLFSGTSGRLGGNYARRTRLHRQSSNSPSLVLQQVDRVPRIQSGYALSSAGASEGWETADGSSVASGLDDADGDPSELPSETALHERRGRWSERSRRSLREELDDVDEGSERSLSRGSIQAPRSHLMLSIRKPLSVLASRPLRSQITQSRGAGHRLGGAGADEASAFI